MRKIFTLSLLTLTLGFASAQENDIKNFRFGLKLTPSVNWFKPEGKIIKNDGAALKYGGGLVLEYRLAKIISVQTGFQLDVVGGKAQYDNGTAVNTNSVSYFYNKTDDKIVEYDTKYLADTSGTYQHFQLNGRSYTVSYITLPISLKMKTKEIGSFTYYGQFGLNNSVRWKALAKDDRSLIDDVTKKVGNAESLSKIDVTKDINLYMGSLNMGLGAELNLSGSTSFTFGLNYNLGFTSVVKNKSKYLERTANEKSGPVLSSLEQQINSNSIQLLLGVLF